MSTNVLEDHYGYLDKSPLRDPRHRGAIQSLAQELGLPFDTVAVQYEELLREMATHARVADFLPVLVVKQLREVFKSGS